MTLKSEVAELRYEVAELSSGELRLTFTTADDNTAAVAPTLNCGVLHVLPNFYVYFILLE